MIRFDFSRWKNSLPKYIFICMEIDVKIYFCIRIYPTFEMRTDFHICIYDTRSIENYFGDIAFHASDVSMQIRDIRNREEMLFDSVCNNVHNGGK